jgi:hypothetical protein
MKRLETPMRNSTSFQADRMFELVGWLGGVGVLLVQSVPSNGNHETNVALEGSDSHVEV